MPRALTRYECEKCDEKFETEKEALKCEANHAGIAEIMSFRYGSFYCCSDPTVPRELTVRLTDGRMAAYEICRIWDGKDVD